MARELSLSLLFLGLLASFLHLCFVPNECEESRSNASLPAYTLEDVEALRADSDKLEARMRNLDRFHEVLESVVDDLLHQRRDLLLATIRVFDAAERDSPPYLQSLHDANDGHSDLERVALNLVWHLEIRIENGDCPDAPSYLVKQLKDEARSTEFCQKCRQIEERKQSSGKEHSGEFHLSKVGIRGNSNGTAVIRAPSDRNLSNLFCESRTPIQRLLVTTYCRVSIWDKSLI